MAPLGLRDREAGTVTLTTSQALWKKLDRIRRNPGVAVAYHAREHGLTDRSGFVLVQGRASFPTTPDRDWLESITPEWERFLGPRSTGLAGRMLDVYYWHRVPITIAGRADRRLPRRRGERASRRSSERRRGPPARPAGRPAAAPGRGSTPPVAAQASGCRTPCSAGAVRTTCPRSSRPRRSRAGSGGWL